MATPRMADAPKADYYAWKGDRPLLDQLWPNGSLAAMDWIDRNCAKTGYITYDPAKNLPPVACANQGAPPWRDSGDCIVNAAGHIAEGGDRPIGGAGLCLWPAKVRLSRLARFARPTGVMRDRWQAEGCCPKSPGLNEISRLAVEGFFAPGARARVSRGIASPLTRVTSGVGISSPGKGPQTWPNGSRLPICFSGGAVRTLSRNSPATTQWRLPRWAGVAPRTYGFDCGGVFDRWGYTDQALEIAKGIVDIPACSRYGSGPPELTCGLWRQHPSQNRPWCRYPVACSLPGLGHGQPCSAVANRCESVLRNVPN